jgi:hypothetical protein
LAGSSQNFLADCLSLWSPRWPASFNGQVYVGNQDKNLYAFGACRGRFECFECLASTGLTLEGW